jgi:hypothetical protein
MLQAFRRAIGIFALLYPQLFGVETCLEPLFILLVFSGRFGDGLGEEAPRRWLVGACWVDDYGGYFVLVGLEATGPFLYPANCLTSYGQIDIGYTSAYVRNVQSAWDGELNGT